MRFLSQALGLNGQKLLGVPVIVQPSQAEKNRIAGSYADLMSRGAKDKVRNREEIAVLSQRWVIFRTATLQFKSTESGNSSVSELRHVAFKMRVGRSVSLVSGMAQ